MGGTGVVDNVSVLVISTYYNIANDRTMEFIGTSVPCVKVFPLVGERYYSNGPSLFCYFIVETSLKRNLFQECFIYDFFGC